MVNLDKRLERISQTKERQTYTTIRWPERLHLNISTRREVVYVMSVTVICTICIEQVQPASITIHRSAGRRGGSDTVVVLIVSAITVLQQGRSVVRPLLQYYHMDPHGCVYPADSLWSMVYGKSLTKA